MCLANARPWEDAVIAEREIRVGRFAKTLINKCERSTILRGSADCAGLPARHSLTTPVRGRYHFGHGHSLCMYVLSAPHRNR